MHEDPKHLVDARRKGRMAMVRKVGYDNVDLCLLGDFPLGGRPC